MIPLSPMLYLIQNMKATAEGAGEAGGAGISVNAAVPEDRTPRRKELPWAELESINRAIGDEQEHYPTAAHYHDQRLVATTVWQSIDVDENFQQIGRDCSSALWRAR